MAKLAGLLSVSILLVTLSMLFSISESAFLSMNKLRLRVLRKKKDKRALRVGKLLDRKEILINTLLVANDLVNILLSSILTAVSMRLFGQKGVGYATFAVTLILLVFGEITPKAISTRNPDGIAYALSLFVKIVVIILKPLVIVFTGFARIVLKIRGVNVKNQKELYSEEDIKSFIEAGGETGILENGEKNMMNRVFKFSDLEAYDVMVPRTSIVMVRYDFSYKQIIELAQRTRFSRFPVYKESTDNIIGVLYLKDMLNFSPEDFSLKKVMRPPLFIPGSKKISSVQQVMQENRQSIAIIIDEYAGTDGLLTQSDIYREIFGTNENNMPWRNSPNIQKLKGKTEFNLDGATLLLDMKDIIGIKLNSEVNETLGGWITEKLNRLPVVGDSVTFEGWSFTVKAVFQRRITEIHLKKLSSKEEVQ